MSKQMLELADRLASMPASEAVRDPQDWAMIMQALRQSSADSDGVPRSEMLEALANQRRRMGAEYDTLYAELKRVREVARAEIERLSAAPQTTPSQVAALTSAVANLRHAYMQLASGSVKLKGEFAKGLISPQIEKIEQVIATLSSPHCQAVCATSIPADLKTDPELLALIERAKTYVMSPEETYEQRRSFTRGMCPSNRNYKEWCEAVDKLLPPLSLSRQLRPDETAISSQERNSQ